jgi:predicted ATPase
MVAFHAGEFPAARDAMEAGLAIYDPRAHDPNLQPAFWGGHNTGVSCAVHAAWALWALGHADRAAEHMRVALEWARGSDHPFTLAFACHFAATFHEIRREVDAAKLLADEAVLHSTQHEFLLFASLAAVHRGWQLGDPDELRAGVTAYRATGSGFGLQTYLGFLAEACAKHDRSEEGLEVVADALAIADATASHYWDAELERIRGVLTLQGHRRATSAQRHAEASFRRAIEIAQTQSAKMLELRAATDLCRLWRTRGNVDDARALLSATHAWFTEGFETADLRDAKTLLDELGGPARRRR